MALTGASGAIYGVRLIEALNERGINVHLVISKAAEINLRLEMNLNPAEVTKMAQHVYASEDMAAPIASGSFPIDGMIIVPCSTKTLAAVANGLSLNLISRAAEVSLKERKPLVLVPRETPLNQIHLQNMLTLARAGAIIIPASPGFYHRPKSIEQLVDHIVGKVLDVFAIQHDLFTRWHGPPSTSNNEPA